MASTALKSILIRFIFIASAFALALFVLSYGASGHEPSGAAVPAVEEIKPTAQETHHLEVKPESLEGYRIPYMEVTVTIADPQTGQERTVEFHPMFGGNFHYGVNVALEPKQYTLKFHLDPPTFMRGHARENQWLTPVEAGFTFDAAAAFEKSILIGTNETQDMKIKFEAEHAEEMFVLAGAEAEHEEHGVRPAPSGAQNRNVIVGAVSLILGIFAGFILSRFWKRAPRQSIIAIILVGSMSILVVPSVFAHSEPGGGMMQTGTMGEMMEMMHGQIDRNQAANCAALTGEQFMESGEDMMEEMMGHEDHERVEEAMEQDMRDHDAMHVMMGMWATGCVGDEVAASIAPRYGFVSSETQPRQQNTGVLAGTFAVGLIVGALGWQVIRRRPPSA